MGQSTSPLITAALIIFAVLFVVSGVFLTLWQCLRYHYRLKLNDVEQPPACSQLRCDELWRHPQQHPQQQQQQEQLSTNSTLRVAQGPTIAHHSSGLGINNDYEFKPLPPRPPKPVATPRTAPRRAAPIPARLVLGARPDLPTSFSHPSAPEQSHFSDDDDDEKEDEKTTRRAKSWFPPKPFRLRASRAGTSCVSSMEPQIIQSASRWSRRLSQLHWSQQAARIETADVPIVSTPRDLCIDRPPPAAPSHTLGSPFQYHQRSFSDRRDTVIGPDNQQRRGSRDHLNHHPSPELFAGEAPEQANVV
ncbi:hypothetical protein LTR70_009410 [Exophiala xenobiotica]|nr:hypothetical protein LTR70_009410 [Exophiala xenobiotica]